MTAATIADVPALVPAKRFNPRHVLVLARRNIVKSMRTPEQFMDVTLQPVIFLTVFTYIFGGALAGGSQHAYLEFLLPGMLGQTIVMTSVAIGQNLHADIDKGIFDRFRALPIGRAAPLIGAVLAEFIRYVIVCGVSVGYGYAIGFRIHTDPLKLLGALALAVCFAACFAWVSVFVGMTVRTAGAVQGVMMLLIMPLTFGSNTFVKTTTMPGWLQAFVKVNPLSHLVSAVRALMLGGPAGADIGWTLAWCAGMLAVFFPMALRAYIRRA
ncbi:MAG: ABC transporter permease [Streptosporangiales bacterium]|nr:ABC transporter permease [Streptosporangiales bacterium]